MHRPSIEGERQFTKDTNKLGEFQLNGFPPMPRGVPQIEITFDVDANGILHVTAQEKSSGKIEKIEVTNDKGRLSAEDIQRMVDEADRFKEDDMKLKEQLDAKSSLEEVIFSTKNSLKDIKNKSIEQSEIDEVKNKVTEMEEWLNNNNKESSETYNTKASELQQFLQPFMLKMAAADNMHTDNDTDVQPEEESTFDELDLESSIGDLD